MVPNHGRKLGDRGECGGGGGAVVVVVVEEDAFVVITSAAAASSGEICTDGRQAGVVEEPSRARPVP